MIHKTLDGMESQAQGNILSLGTNLLIFTETLKFFQKTGMPIDVQILKSVVAIRSWIFVFPPRLVLVALVSFFLRFHVETGAKKTGLAPN